MPFGARDLVDAFAQGRLKPGPVLPVPWEETQGAMEHMAAARHIGKVVLVIRKAADRITDRAPTLGGGKAIPLQTGLDLFQELLQRIDLPPHVVASVRPLGSGANDQAPALRSGGVSAHQRTANVAYRAPSNSTEEQIVKIWEQVLSVDSIGVDDDFLELGGDSISSIQILNRIRKTIGVRLHHDAMFNFRTPALLSEAVLQQTAAV